MAISGSVTKEQGGLRGWQAALTADNLLRGLLLALAALAILITRHYGESWDELKFYKYADEALQAYVTWPTEGSIPLTGNTYDNYGPVYVMAVALVARGLEKIIPWTESDLRHLLYFLTFLAGVWAFYRIGKRWLSPAAALGATLLMLTQPVLWGHAFMSPKDIPFLSLFLLALDAGLRAFEREGEHSVGRSTRSLILFTVAWLLGIAVLFGGTAIFHGWLETAVRAAAAGQDNLLARLASDIRQVAPEVYITKYFVLFLRLRAAAFILSTIGLFLLYLRRSPGTLARMRHFVLPGILLGLTVCVRVLGPLVGLLVALFALQKHGRKAIPALAIYAGIAIAAMYATWPYLWPDPVGHFIESIVVMAKYPWQGQVLYNGVMYDSTAIPRSYLPVLLGIQMTEPIWILFLAGLGLTLWQASRRKPGSAQMLWLTALWFLLPAAGFIALRSPLYDNFRQVFFILPPVFLMAGAVFDLIQKPIWRAALIALCLVPGLVAGLRLHPYEYIYYNGFIGREAGAFRRFELDYWGTSYREAAGWLNEHAPANASLWVEGPSHLLGIYLRPDLKLFSSYEAATADHYDYIVSTTRYDLDLRSYPQAPVIYTVERGGAPLTVIKQP